MTEQDKLTPEQIENWREMLSLSMGPAAYFLPDDLIQRYRDKIQREADKEAQEHARRKKV